MPSRPTTEVSAIRPSLRTTNRENMPDSGK
jgi:hypothetical protein